MKITKINLITQEIFCNNPKEKFLYRFEFQDFSKEDLNQILRNGKREIMIGEMKPKLFVPKKKYTKHLKPNLEIQEKLNILNITLNEGSLKLVKDKSIEEIKEFGKKYIPRHEVLKKAKVKRGKILRFFGNPKDEPDYKYNEQRKELNKNIITLTKSYRLYPVDILKKYGFIS